MGRKDSLEGSLAPAPQSALQVVAAAVDRPVLAVLVAPGRRRAVLGQNCVSSAELPQSDATLGVRQTKTRKGGGLMGGPSDTPRRFSRTVFCSGEEGKMTNGGKAREKKIKKK